MNPAWTWSANQWSRRFLARYRYFVVNNRLEKHLRKRKSGEWRELSDRALQATDWHVKVVFVYITIALYVSVSVSPKLEIWRLNAKYEKIYDQINTMVVTT